MLDLAFVIMMVAASALVMLPVFSLGARLRSRKLALLGVLMAVAAFALYALLGAPAMLNLPH